MKQQDKSELDIRVGDIVSAIKNTKHTVTDITVNWNGRVFVMGVLVRDFNINDKFPCKEVLLYQAKDVATLNKQLRLSRKLKPEK